MSHRYNPQQAVGEWFEEMLAHIFYGLKRVDRQMIGKLPDLVYDNGLFYIEAKFSAYNNGGVINKRQLERFDNIQDAKRFYAFGFHSITRGMQRNYPRKDDLRNALDIRSIYIFPSSIVRRYFEMTDKTVTQRHDDLVQIDEKTALDIFRWKSDIWETDDMRIFDYRYHSLHQDVHIITRGSDFEKELMESFHPEFLSFNEDIL
ncbi:MAG: hypothetical protein ABIA21_02710 [Candidatus Aenigmatarchaeota archaeon]